MATMAWRLAELIRATVLPDRHRLRGSKRHVCESGAGSEGVRRRCEWLSNQKQYDEAQKQ